MASKIPYMLAPGIIPKVFEKIQQARRPERFTQDYLETKLGHSGGSARPIIPLLKRMGFIASDGSPTPRYDQFRNDETQGIAVAEGMKEAFSDLFERNEYVYEMPREKLASLVVEITGASKDDRPTKAVVGTFLALKEFADFEADVGALRQSLPTQTEDVSTSAPKESRMPIPRAAAESVGFNVSYTINLNLPETADPDVFNAIFRSLSENLLKSQ